MKIWVAAALLAFMLLGCGTSGKQAVAQTALDVMTVEQRHESMEATLRLLDEHPELVDELYALARLHPTTMHSFAKNIGEDLANEPTATVSAKEVVARPKSMAHVMIVTTDLIAKDPNARAVLANAMAERADVTVDILTDYPDAMTKVLAASIAMFEKKPKARAAALAGVHHERARIVAFLKEDHAFGKQVAKDLLAALVEDKPTLEKVLKLAGLVDP